MGRRKSSGEPPFSPEPAEARAGALLTYSWIGARVAFSYKWDHPTRRRMAGADARRMREAWPGKYGRLQRPGLAPDSGSAREAHHLPEQRWGSIHVDC